MNILSWRFLNLIVLVLLIAGCTKKTTGGDTPPVNPPKPEPLKTDVLFYLTTPDRSVLFSKQNTSLLFSSTANPLPTIEIDESKSFQTIEGFGYTLTGGSASLINSLNSSAKDALLKELFLTDSTHIGVSYLRISIGASDLSSVPFTYNDMSAGQTDETLKTFSLDRERTELIPVLKQIIALNPDIKIMGSPWTAPAWMKTNGSFIGGKLKPEYYTVYANYLVKYILEMKKEGIIIDAITPQNEPLHGGNNPSMLMLANEQAAFIKDHLGPAFEAATIKTKIIIYDHNADKPDYPISVLNDPQAKKYISGSAFHLYGGDISALSTVHNAHPDKGIYFTEQWVGGPGNFGGDLQWHISNLIIGATRNWSRNVLEWNLAADANYRPHTNGGCTNCLGAISIDNNSITRNVAYYIIAHASKFARPGSVRIESNNIASLQNVAFRNPEGKKVLIVLNSGNSSQTFNIKSGGKMVSTTLLSGAVGTYVW
ncbi:glycoside hydrolase family 30 protein [Daejeonella oryzae]|uniref:glycoside hydrolase family 30 protein n=1 Tax=Daejeonella oryzae TaxID=1122943 RepID=UPI00040DF52F|nr:glycoside hydrolase family 30 beta sandwich domain-containing protein [Daejeonella oryzae]